MYNEQVGSIHAGAMSAPPKNLNESLTLQCGVTLKNRLVKAAMTENLADEHSRATARHCALYAAWADGGSGPGLLITMGPSLVRCHIAAMAAAGTICALLRKRHHAQLCVPVALHEMLARTARRAAERPDPKFLSMHGGAPD